MLIGSNLELASHTNNASKSKEQTLSLQVLSHAQGNSPHAVSIVLRHKRLSIHVASIHTPIPFGKHHCIPQILLSLKEELILRLM